MPFTLCHPAIVLPLHARARHLISLPALVIGSMAPDFVYFLPLGANGYFTHSVPGIFMYCLPAGLLVYFTHPNTIVVRHLDVLQRPVFSLGGHAVPLLKLLQDLSSLVGFLVIAAYVRHWIRVTEAGPSPCRQLSARQRLYAVMRVAMSAVAGGAAGVLLRPARTSEHALFNAVVTAMAMAGLATLFFCVVRRVRALRGLPRRCMETESDRDEPAA